MARTFVSPRVWRTLLGAPVLAAMLAGSAQAQSATLAGKITAAGGQNALAGNVRIPTLNVGATANANGQFSFTVSADLVRGQQVQITARFIGYEPLTKTITLSAGSQTVDFALKADPFRLSEVVVSGTAEGQQAKKLPFSVTRVTEEQLKEVPASSPIAALAGKVSGARIGIGRGNPGAPPTIRLRGSTNLGVGGSSPLILVDGVITRFTIADLDAQDIESIEVLKGAAASAFYGSDAANGVINITTKRGKSVADNTVQMSVRSEYGTSGLNRWVPLNEYHQFTTNADGSIATNANGARTVKADGIADNRYPSTGTDRYRNQLQEWLNDGDFYTTNFQLGMRRGGTNFNSSFTSDRNQGIVPFRTGQFRQSARVNVDQAINDKADFGASLTYTLSNNDYDPGSTEGWFALLQAPPDIDLKRPNGASDPVDYFPLLDPNKVPSARGNPLYGLVNSDYNLRRERLLGSFSARYRPFEWLRVDGSYGTDRSNVRNRSYNFRGFLNSDGVPGQGSLNIGSDNSTAENLQANATATKLFGSLLSTTRGTYLVEKQYGFGASAGASRLVVSETPDLGAGDPTVLSVNTSETIRNTINYMVSQSFDYKDKYIVDGLWRRDGSSLFGANERWQDFYRIAGTWRVTEDFTIPGIQEGRIRAARGTAGLRPGYSDQYETYSLGGGQISKAQLGNANLKPAIQTENEFGVNVTFLDRFDLEMVRANRVTEGAFLGIPLSSAQSGGFTSQTQNAARVSSRTFEMSLQTRAYDSADWSWTIGLTGDRTTQKVDELGRAPFRANATGAQGQDMFYIQGGQPLGIIYGAKWIRDVNELKDNPANANIDLNLYEKNSDGYVILKSRKGTSQEAPIAYVDANRNTQHIIGDVNPDFAFGLANTIRYKNFSVYALIDGSQGGDVYNFTKQWMYQDGRHGTQGQGDRPAADRRPIAFYSSGLYNGLVASDHFVEDGSYVRFRELSVAYNVSTRFLERAGFDRFAKGMKLALLGRNLTTWTNYSGFDPEANAGNDFNYRVDGFRYPNFRTITGQIEINF